MRKNAKIHTDPTTPGASSFEVNGQRLRGVRGYAIHWEPGCLPQLEIDFAIHELDVNGDMQLHIPDRVRDSLIALGWTPPANNTEEAADAR